MNSKQDICRMNSTLAKPLLWVNVGKVVAMLAVIVNHTHFCKVHDVPIYESDFVAYSSFFSVTVFIFLSGVTAYLSAQRKGFQNNLKRVYSNVKKIVIPYLFAAVFYALYNERDIGFLGFLHKLIIFTVSGHFYFVAVILSLIVAAPILCWLQNMLVTKLKRRGRQITVLVVFLIFTLGFTLSKFIIFPECGLAAKYLFGGTYLPVYFSGIVFAANAQRIQALFSSFAIKIFAIVCCLVTLVLSLQLFIQGLQPRPAFSVIHNPNPPGVLLILYSFSVVFIIYLTLFNKGIDSKNKLTSTLTKWTNFSAQYTLYIFLYHIIIMQLLAQLLEGLPAINIWVARVLFVSCMFFVPVFVTFFYKKLFKRSMLFFKSKLDKSEVKSV